MKILIAIFFPLLLFGNFFQNRITNAQSGDFVIYENNKNASLFIFTEVDKNTITLEEIAFPSYLYRGIKDVKLWVDKKAPGHTLWRVYQLDRKSFDLLEAYSIKEQAHITFPQNQFFLSTLLKLPLKVLSESSRKKVGPPPSRGKEDRRKLWNPPIFIDGKKEKKESIAYFTKWPKDDSHLSEKLIKLYFTKDSSLFPHWIEIYAAKTTFTIRVIDSGNRPFFSKGRT